MKLSKVLVSPVVSSLLTVAAYAAFPTFPQQTIELPPLTLAENAKACLRPFERSTSGAPAHIVIPERRIVSSDKFVVSPLAGVDYKMLIKKPILPWTIS